MIVILVSVLVYAISFLLLRALSRYREFAADRGSAVLTGPPERARLGADQDQRHDRAGAQPGPAQRRRHERVLHRPGAGEELADEPLRRPPAARAAPGRAASGSRRSCRAPPEPAVQWACATSSPAATGQGAGARPPVRDHDRLRHARDRAPDRSGRRRRDRLPGARHERLRSDAARTRRRSSRPPASESGTTVATEDDSYGYRWMVLRNPRGAERRRPRGRHQRVSELDRDGRPRRAAAVRGVRVQGRRSDASDQLHLQLQARLLVPVRAGPGRHKQQR